jgi:long-chain-fatty-acid---luciferin-component ligase
MTISVQSERLQASNGRPAGGGFVRLRPSDLGPLDELIYEGTDSYAAPFDEERRFRWIAAAAEHHLRDNIVFRRLAKHAGFSPQRLLETGDASLVPLVSSAVFKRRDVSTPVAGHVRLCKSSGTRGSQSVVPRDQTTLERFIGSVLHGLREFHGHSSVRQSFVLSPTAHEAGDIWFSYVLTLVELLYDTQFFLADGRLRAEELYQALAELEPGAEPTIVAPPGLLVDFLAWMEERGLRLDLGERNGFVVTAGGWKRREAESVDRAVLAATVEERLAVPPERMRDAFNMVELNTVLFECDAARKHVPPWLLVQARRPSDLSVADPGEEGLLAYLDPTALSYPGFVLSDDFGRVDAPGCPCGRHGETVAIKRRLSTIEERGCALKLDRYSEGGRR